MEPYGVAGFKLLISEIIFATPEHLAERLRHSGAKRGLRIPLSPPDSKAVTSPQSAQVLLSESDNSKKIAEPVDFAAARSTLE